MTHSKKQLDDLLGSVAHDTPSLERNELRSLLEQKTSGNLVISPAQITIINEDRSRGLYKKGIIIMTLIAIIATVFLLNQQPLQAPISSKIEIPSGRKTIKRNSESLPSAQENNLASKSAKTEEYTKTDSKSIKLSPVPIVQPIPKLELNDADLAKLGIVKKANGNVSCYQDIHSDKVMFKMFFQANTFGVNAGLRAKSHCELGNAIPTFIPEYITNMNGSKVSASGFDSTTASIFDQLTPPEIERVDEIAAMQEKIPIPDLSSKLTAKDIELIEKLTKLKGNIEVTLVPLGKTLPTDANELIPVLVRKNSFTEGKEQNNGLIFWYAPIPKVMDIINKSGKLNVNNINSESANKIISGSLYPNPAKIATTFHYSLKETRSVNFLIYEITGKLIKKIGQQVSLPKGEFEIEIQTTDLQPGIYLVVIETNLGEQSIHRLIITK